MSSLYFSFLSINNEVNVRFAPALLLGLVLILPEAALEKMRNTLTKLKEQARKKGGGGIVRLY